MGKKQEMVTSDFNLQKVSTVEYSDAIIAAMQSKTAIAVFGRRGSGKTQIAKELIKKQGYREVYMNLSVMERVDLGGYPNLLNGDGDYVKFRLQESFKPMIEGKEKVVLVLDEVDKAEPSLWAPLLELTQFFSINHTQLPNLHAVIMTGNLISEGGNKPCLPLLDRAAKFLIEPDVDSWMKWAGESGKIHGSVSAYINDNREDLYGQVDPDSSYADPSPRSWENASKYLKQGENENWSPEKTYKMVAGCVGNAVGVKYRAYFDHYQKILPLVKKLFDGKDITKEYNALKVTEQLVACMIVASRLSSVIDEKEKELSSKKMSKEVDEALTNAAKLLIGVSHEYCLICVRSQINIERILKYNLDDHESFGKVLARVKQKINGK